MRLRDTGRSYHKRSFVRGRPEGIWHDGTGSPVCRKFDGVGIRVLYSTELQ
jgi:hypothetical protein